MNKNQKRAWIVVGTFWIVSITYFILQSIAYFILQMI